MCIYLWSQQSQSHLFILKHRNVWLHKFPVFSSLKERMSSHLTLPSIRLWAEPSVTSYFNGGKSTLSPRLGPYLCLLSRSWVLEWLWMVVWSFPRWGWDASTLHSDTPQRRRGSLYKPPQDASGAYLTQFILAEGQESENGWRECLVGGEWGYERVIEWKGHV